MAVIIMIIVMWCYNLAFTNSAGLILFIDTVSEIALIMVKAKHNIQIEEVTSLCLIPMEILYQSTLRPVVTR